MSASGDEKKSIDVKTALAKIQQQKQEIAKQEAQAAAAKQTEIGQTKTNVYDSMAALQQFQKDSTRVKVSEAANQKTYQQNRINEVQQKFNEVTANKDQYLEGVYITYARNVGEYLKNADENIESLNQAIAAGTDAKIIYGKNIKKLEKEALKPHLKKVYGYKSQPTKEQKEAEQIGKLALVGPPSSLKVTGLGRVAQEYEGVFKNVSDALTDAIKNAKTQAIKAKSEGKPIETILWYGLAETTTGGRGAFNGVTFVVRPKQWEESAKTINTLLTPSKNESVSSYQNRVRQIVEGDIVDPVLREKMVKQLLATMPKPTVSEENIEAGKKYRAVLIDTILSDPISFVAEVAGGVAGGWLAGQIIGRLPAAIRRITPKTLEQKAFAKIHPLNAGEPILSPDITAHPLDSLSDSAVSQIESGIGSSPATSLGKGKYTTPFSKTYGVGLQLKPRKGMTAIIVLADPKTQAIKGFLSLAEAMEITGGMPELLSTMGGLQAIPMVYIDPNISDANYKSIQTMLQEQPTIPASALKEIQENDEILATLLSLGIVVIPDLSQVSVHDQSVINLAEQASIQEISQVQDVVQEVVPKEIPVEITDPTVITPPLKLSLEDKEKRRAMNLGLHNGRRMLYRVSYPDLKQVIGPLDARSFPDALGKAQRQRRTAKKLPRTIIVDLIGERKV